MKARARKSHPATSHKAAKSVDGLNAKQAAVLKVLKAYKQMTHESLCYVYQRLTEAPHQSDSSIRSRCHELVVKGKVYDTGLRMLSAYGRECIVWGVR